MFLFLTLCSLAALAHARPQGYNYGGGSTGNFGGGFSQFGGSGGHSGFSSAPKQQSGGGFGGFGGFSGGPSSSGSSFGSSGGGFGGFSGGPSTSGSSFGSSGGGVGGFSGGPSSSGSSFGKFNSGGFQGQQQQQQQQGGGFEAPLVHKQFITITAPEDNDVLERGKHLVIGRPQKNYRVVFIKAPSASSSNVKLSAEYAPQEEKTVIYVLTKKDNELDINDIATPAPSVASKPEVFFIKYKTDEEAHHAQAQIQAEYDQIDGTSEHTDGGVAPQKSVVGILGDGVDSGAASGLDVRGLGGTTGTGGGSGAKSSTYLPPNRKY